MKACNHFKTKLLSGVRNLSAEYSCTTQLKVDRALIREVAKWKTDPCAIWET